MEKEYLYKKWLNDELTPSELEAFEKLDDADLSQEILEEATRFKVPDHYHVDDFETFKAQKATRKETSTKVIRLPWLRKLSSIAAIVVITLGLYYVFTSQNQTTITTQIAQKETITLPDQSQVTLNAMSSIRYAEDTWSEKRELSLEGEAFFKVAKGAKFDVKTNDGVVSVLGTSFNVKQRDQFFEVICYEGLVSVTYNNQLIKLPAGNTFRLDHGVTTQGTIFGEGPQWINYRSVFSKVAVAEVFKEVERQYDVQIDFSNIDSTILFSGGFEHIDLTEALTSITGPLKMTFTKQNNSVVIHDTTH
ncbi:FecR family protein [Dokdonia ponticola]|uniref:FecR family protein n=1 Tax=Dokdonia ponticola TaxID=2041041 RepID=A0ABV9HRV8_9FLAO